MSQLLEDLRAVRELLQEPGVWQQGHYATAVDKMGRRRSIEPQDPDASCFCLVGAVMRVTGDSHLTSPRATAIFLALNKPLAGKANLGEGPILVWNDKPGRTAFDVIGLLDSVIAGVKK